MPTNHIPSNPSRYVVSLKSVMWAVNSDTYMRPGAQARFVAKHAINIVAMRRRGRVWKAFIGGQKALQLIPKSRCRFISFLEHPRKKDLLSSRVVLCRVGHPEWRTATADRVSELVAGMGLHEVVRLRVGGAWIGHAPVADGRHALLASDNARKAALFDRIVAAARIAA